MRIHYSVSGGLAYFPGLASPRTLDTAALPAEIGTDLTESVAASGFFALPHQVGVLPPGAADVPQYTLTIEDNGRAHTVRILDSVQEPTLQDLLQRVGALLDDAAC
jgi:hypothetical protein